MKDHRPLLCMTSRRRTALNLIVATCASTALLGTPTAVLAQGNPVSKDNPVVWKFAHTTSVPGIVWHRYATEVLAPRISEASKGAVKIEVMTGVIQPADLMRSIREGTVHGGSLIFPYVGATLPTWNIMALPGLLTSEAQYPALVNKVLMPFVKEDAARRYKARPVAIFGMTGASWFANKPVDTVDKVKSTKLRAHSPELTQLIEAAGGGAVAMQFGEVNGAMQKNMIDAYTGALPAIYASKLYEVTKYAIDWPAGLGGAGYFISTVALEKLPESTRTAVLAEFEKINLEMQRATLEEATESGTNLKAKGMNFITVSPAERAKMNALAKEKVWPFWVKNAGTAGEQLLKSMQEAAK